MFPNVKLSEQFAVLDAISPVSQAPGSVTTAWVSVQNFNKFLAVINVGAFGASATVDANIQQAQDNAGTGAKAFATPLAITQALAAGGNNKQLLINGDAQNFDVENSYCFIRLTVTVGTAATLVGATLLGGVPRMAPASDFNNASVTQVVG